MACAHVMGTQTFPRLADLGNLTLNTPTPTALIYSTATRPLVGLCARLPSNSRAGLTGDECARLALTGVSTCASTKARGSPGRSVLQGGCAAEAGVGVPRPAPLSGRQAQATPGHSWRIKHGVQSVLSLEIQSIRRVTGTGRREACQRSMLTAPL